VTILSAAALPSAVPGLSRGAYFVLRFLCAAIIHLSFSRIGVGGRSYAVSARPDKALDGPLRDNLLSAIVEG
jgi:hypothetical protein